MEQYSAGHPGRVSVVTPVHNGRRYLPAMLQSVLGQSWDDVEMILVDDGSEDGTAELARGYREAFLRRGYSFRLLQGEHRGAAGAINRGLPYVTGEFLIWPDSDDLLEPDSIRRRVEFLRQNPAYQCVRSLSRYIDEDGGPAPPSERRGDLDQERLFLPLLLGQTFVCCGCYLFRTQPFFEIYPRRQIPDYEVGQNLQMLLPFFHRWPCPTIREELYIVRVHPDSHSRRPRTREEAAARCAGFGALIDELAAICRLEGRELRQADCWKLQQRYLFYLASGPRWKAAVAVAGLLRNGGIRPREALGRMAGLLARQLRPLVRRIGKR